MIFYNNIIKKTYLIINIKVYSQNKCYMHRSRCIASNNTFHLLERLCDQKLLDQTTNKKHTFFMNSLFDHCYNPNEGIIQHKYTLIHSIFRGKYPSEFWAKIYQDRFPNSVVTFAPNAIIDFRLLGELPVIHHYENTFKENIKNILLTGDSMHTTFEKQKQSCPDLIAELSSYYGNKSIYQDIKSGRNMAKHASRGSLGIITYDTNQKPIPFTTHDLTLNDINKERIEHLGMSLKYDNICNDFFTETLKECFNILKMEKNTIKANNQIQKILWTNFQCNPLYKRSVAFTFTEHQSVISFTDKKHIYKQKFVSLLSERTYDPNKIGDRKEIYKAMLLAYREVEPQLAFKLNHLVKTSQIEFDSHFLHVLAHFIKETLT